MNTKPIIAVAMAFALPILISCSSGNKKEQTELDQHDHPHEQPTDESVAETGEITKAYLDLKNAFVETDASKAADAAKKLEMAFHNNNLHSEAEMAKAISQTDNVDEQRKTFKTLSEKMYQLASEGKMELNTTLYKQYCPMAFDNTGAFWLSDSKEIRNPYFGDKMLKCGRVEETLAKK